MDCRLGNAGALGPADGAGDARRGPTAKRDLGVSGALPLEVAGAEIARFAAIGAVGAATRRRSEILATTEGCTGAAGRRVDGFAALAGECFAEAAFFPPPGFLRTLTAAGRDDFPALAAAAFFLFFVAMGRSPLRAGLLAVGAGEEF